MGRAFRYLLGERGWKYFDCCMWVMKQCICLKRFTIGGWVFSYTWGGYSDIYWGSGGESILIVVCGSWSSVSAWRNLLWKGEGESSSVHHCSYISTDIEVVNGMWRALILRLNENHHSIIIQLGSRNDVSLDIRETFLKIADSDNCWRLDLNYLENEKIIELALKGKYFFTSTWINTN